ncbi:MAG TPA: CvpA family protein [Candidatus Sulfotelmatobacter sp.]|nr:CvpA family protein [Candidatus Sulfotelmatobacter sp.]
MDLLDGLRHFNLADVILVLLLVGGFIFGYVTGVVQQLLTLLVWIISLLLAGNLMGSLGDWMGQYWTTFTKPYSEMLAFLAMFVTFLVVGEILIFIFYKRAPMVARLAFLDELVGGLLGVGIAILIIGAFVMGLDSFYQYQQVAATAQQPIAQVIHDGLMNSVIAGWLRGSLIPAIGLLGPLLPAQLQNIA